MRHFYLIVAAVGTVVPLAFFGQFLTIYGLDLGAFVQLMGANPIAAYATSIVLISDVAMLVFYQVEGRRLGIKNVWVYMLLNVAAGGSCGLPLFLYARAGKLQEEPLRPVREVSGM
ncbi:MAG: DUF2834 domain-containing protein [Anaerolineae bacterium]|jgi:uncharacterized membrane protein YcfT|nr:DUF2834 domain-containing protein [Anaerolineae bacterium]